MCQPYIESATALSDNSKKKIFEIQKEIFENQKEILKIQKERSYCSKSLIMYLWVVA